MGVNVVGLVFICEIIVFDSSVVVCELMFEVGGIVVFVWWLDDVELMFNGQLFGQMCCSVVLGDVIVMGDICVGIEKVGMICMLVVVVEGVGVIVLVECVLLWLLLVVVVWLLWVFIKVGCGWMWLVVGIGLWFVVLLVGGVVVFVGYDGWLFWGCDFVVCVVQVCYVLGDLVEIVVMLVLDGMLCVFGYVLIEVDYQVLLSCVCGLFDVLIGEVYVVSDLLVVVQQYFSVGGISGMVVLNVVYDGYGCIVVSGMVDCVQVWQCICNYVCDVKFVVEVVDYVVWDGLFLLNIVVDMLCVDGLLVIVSMYEDEDGMCFVQMCDGQLYFEGVWFKGGFQVKSIVLDGVVFDCGGQLVMWLIQL